MLTQEEFDLATCLYMETCELLNEADKLQIDLESDPDKLRELIEKQKVILEQANKLQDQIEEIIRRV